LDNLQRIAHSLAKRALENGHDPNFYSPFARSAKRSLGINICGKKETSFFFDHSFINKKKSFVR
jgi:hypothetical protein